jgi:Predicted endonuclease distantly related to archaeal Holliday junction resolvase and Mrr-like restriction enzymes
MEIAKDWEFQGEIRHLDQLERYVFSRFNNTLSKKDALSLDNNIMNLEFEINQKTKGYNKKRLDLILPRFQEIMSDYHEQIVLQKQSEQTNAILDDRISDLINLSPREFEEWTASLFTSLGYEKVTLTPLTSDNGIDILAEKDNFKVAVQCKRYKGVVGSPLIQSFLGAMQTAEINKGYFVTTGTFSVEAEKAALNMPVELWDRISLKNIMNSVLK